MDRFHCTPEPEVRNLFWEVWLQFAVLFLLAVTTMHSLNGTSTCDCHGTIARGPGVT